jgi:hypothetical protein
MDEALADRVIAAVYDVASALSHQSRAAVTNG